MASDLAFKLATVAAWVFLAPLIVFLGTADTLSGGRTRTWPFSDVSER